MPSQRRFRLFPQWLHARNARPLGTIGAQPPQIVSFNKTNTTTETTAVEEEAEDETYFDYFYDEPGSIPGTLSIEADAPPRQSS